MPFAMTLGCFGMGLTFEEALVGGDDQRRVLARPPRSRRQPRARQAVRRGAGRRARPSICCASNASPIAQRVQERNPRPCSPIRPSRNCSTRSVRRHPRRAAARPRRSPGAVAAVAARDGGRHAEDQARHAGGSRGAGRRPSGHRWRCGPTGGSDRSRRRGLRRGRRGLPPAEERPTTRRPRARRRSAGDAAWRPTCRSRPCARPRRCSRTARVVAEHGNPNAKSDAGVAVQLAMTALRAR